VVRIEGGKMTEHTKKSVEDFVEDFVIAAWKAGQWETPEFGDSARKDAQGELDTAKRRLIKDLGKLHREASKRRRKGSKRGSLVTDHTKSLIDKLEDAARDDGRRDTVETKKTLKASRSALMMNIEHIKGPDLEALLAIE
jgi:hypothetical protein